MTEQQIEFLEQNFPLGCVVVFRRPKKTDEDDGEPVSVYMINPEKNAVLQLVAESMIRIFDEISDASDVDDVEEEDDFGLFDKNP